VKRGSIAFLDRISGVDRELHATILDGGDLDEVDEVMVILMAGVVLAAGELDPAAFHLVDSPDMASIGAKDFGMFAYFGRIDHVISPFNKGQTQGTANRCMNCGKWGQARRAYRDGEMVKHPTIA
jgi:hypothetical protein